MNSYCIFLFLDPRKEKHVSYVCNDGREHMFRHEPFYIWRSKDYEYYDKVFIEASQSNIKGTALEPFFTRLREIKEAGLEPIVLKYIDSPLENELWINYEAPMLTSIPVLLNPKTWHTGHVLTEEQSESDRKIIESLIHAIDNIKTMKENNPMSNPEVVKKALDVRKENKRRKPPQSNGNPKTYIVIGKDQIEQTITNLSKFCYDNDLVYGEMQKVHRGLIDNHEGWKCYEIGKKEETETKWDNLNKPSFEVISPEGNSFKIKSLKTFCEEEGLNYKSMSAIASGRQKTTQGWKCIKLK
ncbi:MAG: hypothetical protein KAS32_26860 [Candidatus Peribacteraceae bacterium]|nr:hypothetical protein [Candidatus Peribacteraceae bacterium]